MPLVTDESIKRAIQNLGAFGDTDIFPFPFENWFIKERPSEVAEIIKDIDSNFDVYLENYPPQFESTLAPAGYTGFRWVTQIDPFWNLYLLSMVIEIGDALEAIRISTSKNIVHSYRFESGSGDRIFSEKYGWSSFMMAARDLSDRHSYVVATDISEFYRRINHHRLENALDHAVSNKIPDRIISLLTRFSGGSSYGLPIGGPAARILSEITINQIDKILSADGIYFVRFSDDYYIFCNTLADSYRVLQFMSQSLIENQGLTLQKSKTRILTSGEFQASFPKHLQSGMHEPESHFESETVKLLKLSLSYDPYSRDASEDYRNLKMQLSNIDIVGLLAAEAQKAQINISIARKIVATISHLEGTLRINAIRTLLDNMDQFFPIMSTVLQIVRDVVVHSNVADKIAISKLIRDAVKSDSHVFKLELHLSYAVRILAECGAEDDIHLLNTIYKSAPPFIRRDVIMAFAMHDSWELLSNMKAKFNEMTPGERRAFFFSSYALGDEGKHWRRRITLSFKKLDKSFSDWCSSLKSSSKLIVRL